MSQKPLTHRMTQSFVRTSILTAGSTLTTLFKDIVIVYVLQGKLDVVQQKQSLSLWENDFMLFNSMEEYQLYMDENALVVQFQLSYDFMRLFVEQEKLLYCCCSVLEQKNIGDELRGIFIKLMHYQTKEVKEKKVGILKLGFQLFYILLTEYSMNPHTSSSPLRKPSNKQSDRLHKIISYMESNYKQSLTLKEVADLFFVSVPYLSKFFKKEMGMNFSNYLNKIRLEYAMVSLLYSDLPITRIALDSGFPSLTAFNRTFKETYQSSPSQYRMAATKSTQDECVRTVDEELGNEKLHELLTLLQQKDGEGEREVLTLSTQRVREFQRNWKAIVNIGYARDLLNSDLQEQLSLIKCDLGFTYARFWGVFSDDMLIEDPANPQSSYNFSNVDRLIDILIKNNLKPYIELGDKPKLIQKNAVQKMVSSYSSPKERSIEDWSKLIRAFIIHCTNRYGSEEVESWFFELWHSSKHAFKFDEKEYSKSLIVTGEKLTEMELWFQHYLNRFEAMWEAIKGTIPHAKIGGCGLSMDLEGQYLDLLLELWQKRDIHPDFLTIYLYPYEFSATDIHAPVFKHSTDRKWILHKLQYAKQLLIDHQFERLPLHVTEWNFSISNRDQMNDSLFKAAYIAKNITDVLDENCLMGYWVYSDIFSEFHDSKQLLYGGAGLISRNGMKKPAYYAFSLLNKMGKQLLSRGEDFLFTKQSGDRYQLLSFNYKHFSLNEYFNPDSEDPIGILEGSFENVRPIKKTFRLEGLADGNYRMKKYVLSSERGSILNEWIKFGAVHDIQPDEIQFLKQISVPYVSVEHIEVRNGTMEVYSYLQPHEVNLMELDLKI